MSLLAAGAVTGFVAWALAAAVSGAAGAVGAGSAGGANDDWRDVRPILARRCFPCHGADEAHRKAKLRLDTQEGQRGELADGDRAVVPGDLILSELWARVTHPDERHRMPPAKEGDRLSAAELAALRRWIEAGAPFAGHWSFTPPARPAVPPAASLRHASRVRNGIDAFLLARLEREEIEPAPEADRRTLLRRVALDLTGLPPTPEEAAAFATDAAPDAYERRVDSLLASPAFGEHWARVWLDLARFADTKGYEKDLRRELWPWRDWLIRALNDDLPYAAFTERVLAGDLLPQPTEDDRLATAFHRNTMSNDEGGTDDEEFRVAAVKDRVDTTLQVWMGLTAGCAKCHDHKYDPLAQREYYQLFAFFNQTADADRFDEAPTRPYLLPERAEENRAVDAAIAAQIARLEAGPTAPSRRALEPDQRMSTGGQELALGRGAIVQAGGPRPEKDVVTLVGATSLPRLTAVELQALVDDPAVTPSASGGVGRNPADPNFVVSELELAVDGTRLRLASAVADFAQEGWPAEHAVDGNDATGWAVSPRKQEPHALLVKLAEPLALGAKSRVSVTLSQQYGQGLLLARFRVVLIADEAPALDPAWPELAALRARRHPPAAVPVMEELAAGAQRKTHRLVGGSFLSPGEEVAADVPAAFHAWPAEAPRNRLGLARWLTAPENPLAARVAVNRIWARLFGRGLVETEEDFGTQGAAPSHPELLDWLACEFTAGGGSLKRTCRLLVTSSLYRADSRASPGALARDPRNLLLSHSPRARLDAEIVRDQVLAVAGLLSARRYGPSVMPSQPPGIWASVYSGDRWTTSPGEDRHRRSLYTFIKRTSPYPAFMIFDATSREVCTVRRIASNTPLQALVTLNDPVYVEAAQALARRVVSESLQAPPAVAARLFERVLLRPPSTREMEPLLALHASRMAWYRAHDDDARTFAGTSQEPVAYASADSSVVEPADLAAWTAVANALLNVDELVTRP